MQYSFICVTLIYYVRVDTATGYITELCAEILINWFEIVAFISLWRYAGAALPHINIVPYPALNLPSEKVLRANNIAQGLLLKRSLSNEQFKLP